VLNCELVYDILNKNTTLDSSNGLGYVTKADFDIALRALCPHVGGLSNDDVQFLTFAFSNIFYAFDAADDGG